jgi:hypothetical protein
MIWFSPEIYHRQSIRMRGCGYAAPGWCYMAGRLQHIACLPERGLQDVFCIFAAQQRIWQMASAKLSNAGCEK